MTINLKVFEKKSVYFDGNIPIVNGERVTVAMPSSTVDKGESLEDVVPPCVEVNGVKEGRDTTAVENLVTKRDLVFDEKHGKVSSVDNLIPTTGYLDFKYTRERKIYRIIVNGDRGKPLFAAGCVFSKSPQHVKRIMKCHKRRGKGKIGKRLQPKRKRASMIELPSSVPSPITLDDNEKATISSIKTYKSRYDNTNRCLERSKKQTQALKLYNTKRKTKIKEITKQLNLMKSFSREEHKAANMLIESSRQKSAEVLATKNPLIFESKLLGRTIEENRTNEKVERLKIARIEQRKYSNQLISAEKKVVQQKEEKMKS